MSLIGRGAKGYVSTVVGGVKGALGVESIRQAGKMAGTSAMGLRMKTCPRCLELSMVADGNLLQCTRTDICGFVCTKTELEVFKKEVRVDPRVIALAKGFSGSFDERAKGARNISRILWAIMLLILNYGMFWAFSGNWSTATWTFLVAVFCAVQAIRYAYTVRRLTESGVPSPLSFLISPWLWFV